MTDVEITVAANHTIMEPPERGTVHASISLERTDMEAAFDAATADLRRIKESIDAIYDRGVGPITWYAFEQGRTGRRTTRDDDGRITGEFYRTSVDIEVKFCDFEALTRWLRWNLALESLRVHRVEWALTAERRASVERAARQEAVRDARQRAQDYADALGLGPVGVRSICDDGRHRRGYGGHSNRPDRHDERFEDSHLRPKHVEITADVTATFATASARPAAAGR